MSNDEDGVDDSRDQPYGDPSSVVVSYARSMNTCRGARGTHIVVRIAHALNQAEVVVSLILLGTLVKEALTA